MQINIMKITAELSLSIYCVYNMGPSINYVIADGGSAQNIVVRKMSITFQQGWLPVAVLFVVCRKSCCVLWCVGGWKEEELEDLGYIEPIEPNRGAPRATKLVNFNMCRSKIIIRLKKIKFSACLGSFQFLP